MSTPLARVGDIISTEELSTCLANGDGEVMEVSVGNHIAVMWVVWRMSGDDHSPECEEIVSRVVNSVNALQHVPLEVLEKGEPYNIAQQLADAQKEVAKLKCILQFYKEECSGAEPSLSVFHRMVDEALGTG